jgi:hypothetical protein
MFRAASPCLTWQDRRPIGALFIASNFHVSRVNPRGWFNSPDLDVVGNGGAGRFRKAMLDYADRSIEILKRTGSQGMIVWDLEGEEFPHKTTYIGDPRLLPRLAPEAEPVADEFFARFRRAGLAVGLTVRPQRLSFEAGGLAKQEDVGDYDRLLLEKIDYARSRWGATLFYIDSNGGPRWPAEAFRLRQIAQQRPQILLIPEHHDVLYYGFSAPYGLMPKSESIGTRIVRRFYPQEFQVLSVADFNGGEADLEAAYHPGDILVFQAWFNSPSARLIENFARHRD